MSATEAQIEMHSFHSDVYKDARGFRPRWMRPEDLTVEEWQARIDRLIGEDEERVRREREAEERHARWVAEVTACTPLRVPLAAFMTR
jgi:hypothetical protein